jgi:RibD C-terminal domain
MRRMLIEGGADTVSRFIAARCLDRLHITVSPVMLGAGGPGIELPPLERADQAHRMPVRVHMIEDDVLFDCDLSAQRVALGVAKKLTWPTRTAETLLLTAAFRLTSQLSISGRDSGSTRGAARHGEDDVFTTRAPRIARRRRVTPRA